MNAYVNHGRWVADCVTVGCGEAHKVDDGDGFRCGSCGSDHGTIVFPDVDAINRVLDVRPLLNRNWTTETITELAAENAENGTGDGVDST